MNRPREWEQRDCEGEQCQRNQLNGRVHEYGNSRNLVGPRVRSVSSLTTIVSDSREKTMTVLREMEAGLHVPFQDRNMSS